MSGLTLCSSNDGLEARLGSIYGESTFRRVWSDQWSNIVEATMDLCAADPELLIVGADVRMDATRELVGEVDRRYPNTAIVVLVDSENMSHAMDLLRLGARDVIDVGHPDKQLRVYLDRILDVARARRESSTKGTAALRRRVITILSPKGGSGKTTVAANLAVGLAHRQPNKVLLLDLDTQFGDAATALGLQPEHSLIHALASPHLKRSALKVFLTPHHSGLSLLPPPDDLAVVDTIDADSLKKTMAALTEEFPFVVVDTSAGIDFACLAALEFATDLVFVSTTDVPAVRAIRRQIDAFDKIGYTKQRRTFVLNRANAKVGLSVAEVEAAVGLKADFRVRSSRMIPLSVNQGTPVIESGNGNLARTFEEMAEFFAPTTDDAAQSRRAKRKDN